METILIFNHCHAEFGIILYYRTLLVRSYTISLTCLFPLILADFVLTFEENWEMIKIMGSYDNSERENKRDNFVRHCKTIGLLVEYQDHKVGVINS